MRPEPLYIAALLHSFTGGDFPLALRTWTILASKDVPLAWESAWTDIEQAVEEARKSD